MLLIHLTKDIILHIIVLPLHFTVLQLMELDANNL
jgi:hypothetical protein